MPGNNVTNDLIDAIEHLESTVTKMHPITNDQPINSIAETFISSLNGYKTLFLPEDIDTTNMDTTDNIDKQPNQPPITVSSTTDITDNPIKHIIKIIKHKGRLNNTKNPLSFLARFPSTYSNYDQWFTYEQLNNNIHLTNYINIHYNTIFPPIEIANNLIIDTHDIKTIFQHRINPNNRNQFQLNVRYSTINKNDEWINIDKINNLDITNSIMFKNYLIQCKDKLFFNYFKNDFQDKLLFANTLFIPDTNIL